MNICSRIALSFAAAASLGNAAIAQTTDAQAALPPAVACPPPDLVCAQAGSPAFATATPAAHDLVWRIGGLKLTGTPVMKNLQRAENGYTICQRTSMPAGIAAQTNVAGKKMYLPAANPSGPVVAHESFHFFQHEGSPWDAHDKDLSPRDFAFGIFLYEAAAVAYANAVYKEAGFQSPEVYAGYKANYGRYGWLAEHIFDPAFDQAMAQAPQGWSETHKRRNALQDAGRAVVDFFLQGRDNRWRSSYTEQATDHMRGRTFSAAAEDKAYIKRRGAFMHKVTKVRGGLDFLPASLDGDNGGAAIEGYMTQLKFDAAAALKVPPHPVWVPASTPKPAGCK